MFQAPFYTYTRQAHLAVVSRTLVGFYRGVIFPAAENYDNLRVAQWNHKGQNVALPRSVVKNWSPRSERHLCLDQIFLFEDSNHPLISIANAAVSAINFDERDEDA